MNFLKLFKKYLPKPSLTLPDNGADKIIGWVIDVLEGGDKLIIDTGGVTKYGISKKANPDVDVRNLTKAKAIELYKERYWFRNNCQNYKYPLNLIVFDTAVNCGRLKAIFIKDMIDKKYRWQDLLFWRLQHYSNLMAGKSRYDPYAEGWLNRILKIYRKVKSDGYR